MDYGDSWEKAWLTHVEQWERADAGESYPVDYVSAHDWNLQNPRAMLRTQDEQTIDPYPEHFRLTCLPAIATDFLLDLLSREYVEELWQPHVIGYPCRIFERAEEENGDYWYRVLYLKQDEPVPLTSDESTETWRESAWIVREAM